MDPEKQKIKAANNTTRWDRTQHLITGVLQIHCTNKATIGLRTGNIFNKQFPRKWTFYKESGTKAESWDGGRVSQLWDFFFSGQGSIQTYCSLTLDVTACQPIQTELSCTVPIREPDCYGIKFLAPSPPGFSVATNRTGKSQHAAIWPAGCFCSQSLTSSGQITNLKLRRSSWSEKSISHVFGKFSSLISGRGKKQKKLSIRREKEDGWSSQWDRKPLSHTNPPALLPHPTHLTSKWKSLSVHLMPLENRWQSTSPWFQIYVTYFR